MLITFADNKEWFIFNFFSAKYINFNIIMYNQKRWTNRRILLLIFFIIVICILLYYYSIIQSYEPYIPPVRIKRIKTIPFKKVSVVHYTTTYGTRTDSYSNVFSKNLKQICDILDPEEYPYADSVIVTLTDFVRFPTLPDPKESYRKKYQSQLWLLHVEESPRNSYRKVQMNNITELDDWFNLTTTLRPESDLQIQYKVYFHSSFSI